MTSRAVLLRPTDLEAEAWPLAEAAASRRSTFTPAGSSRQAVAGREAVASR